MYQLDLYPYLLVLRIFVLHPTLKWYNLQSKMVQPAMVQLGFLTRIWNQDKFKFPIKMGYHVETVLVCFLYGDKHRQSYLRTKIVQAFFQYSFETKSR